MVLVRHLRWVVAGVAILLAGLAFSVKASIQDRNLSNSESAVSVAAAREAIERQEALWAQARGVINKQAFENALAANFYAQLRFGRLTRDEFITQISSYPPGVKLTRFDNKVLTVEQEGDTSVALILEKIEVEHQTENGKKTEYSMWVTRDGWKKFGNVWKAVFSEVVGVERWSNGERPPLKDW